MFKSKLQQRFMSHLQSKGKLPKDMDLGEPEMKFGGGEVGHEQGDDDMGESWGDDDDWNNHHDTNGEPDDHFDGFAFGGKVKAKENNESSPGGLHENGEMEHANFRGPSEHDETDESMSDGEVNHHLAQALKRRKQLRAGA